MAKKVEERLDLVDQELHKLPVIEENLSLLTKSTEQTNSQIEKQHPQQQVILKYIEVVVISFDGLALDWYQSHDKREAFKDWADLKHRMLVQFQSIRDGMLIGKFLSIKQKTRVEEYRNRFDKLLAPVAFLHIAVLEETFMNGLSRWLKTEVKCLELVGLAQMMKLTLKIENREMMRKECGLKSVNGGNFPFNLPTAKNTITVTTNENTNRGKLADENYNTQRSDNRG
ncbi:transposon Tf2-1 polyprotein isoform X1 [Cucumis melo var. makuwa]|uniref:Transposon Tf2-1 polyprotein isoform X1 n=1 Tax=Cucumis melo var. makuwa TaxID=1194695 RepID=A0A5D3E407_CUCMM|nr:transposon Tf2-1 polyprotein isoform X1 [Cucumis melo var. makuwa]